MFENAALRFALSGTLILGFALADHRAGRARPVPAMPRPRWVRPLILISILVYYALIGPTGGALLGGIGNGIGIALVVVAATFRFLGPVRHPEITARGLFYLALPMAVGVPWGWLALSLPACAASLWCVFAAERAGAPAPAAPASRPQHRLIPGLW